MSENTQFEDEIVKLTKLVKLLVDLQQSSENNDQYSTLTKATQALKFSSNSVVNMSRSMLEVVQLAETVSTLIDTAVPAIRQPNETNDDKFNDAVNDFKEKTRTAVRVYREKISNSSQLPAFTPRKIMNETRDTPKKYLVDIKDTDHTWETKESVVETSFKQGDTESKSKVVDKEFSGNAIKALAGQKNEQKYVVVYQTTTVEDIGGVVSETNTTKTTTNNLIVGEDAPEKKESRKSERFKGRFITTSKFVKFGNGWIETNTLSTIIFRISNLYFSEFFLS